MEFKVSTENARVPVTVLHVDGDIDSASYTEFQSKADDLIKSGARHILLDLAHAKYISSAGLRAIQIIFNQLRDLHPDMNLSDDDMKKGIASGTYKSPYVKIVNLSKEVESAFTMSGFDMFIEVYSDIKAAVASF